MPSDSVVTGLSILGVLVGLAVLLYGEYAHFDSFVYGGGVIVLVGAGILTAFVAGLE